MRFNIFLAFIRICFSRAATQRGDSTTGGRAGNQNQKVEDIQKGHLLGRRWEKSLRGKAWGRVPGMGAQRMELFFCCFLPTGSYSLLIGLFFSWWLAGRTRHGSAPFSLPPKAGRTDGQVSPQKGGPPHNFLSPHILIYHTGRSRGDTHKRPPIVTKSNLIPITLSSLLSCLQTALTMARFADNANRYASRCLEETMSRFFPENNVLT